MALLPLLYSTAGNLTRSNFTDVVINEHFNPEGYGPVTAYALLISLFVVALAYMVAEILKSPQLNAWAKNELYEFIVSALIVGNLVFGLTLLNTMVFDFTGGLDHFGVANDYLDQLIRAPSILNITGSLAVWFSTNVTGHALDLNQQMGDLNTAYIMLWVLEMISGVLGSLVMAFILSAGPNLAYIRVGFTPLAGLSQLTPSLMNMMDMVGVIILATVAQKSLLVFFRETMFRLFLPLGVALRAFPLSRKLGSTLIALAVTCYVVYPLTLAMNLGIYDSTPKYALKAEIVEMDDIIGKLGRSKEGERCGGPEDCNLAPCNSGVCGNKFGMDCRTRDFCEGAPCTCAGYTPCDCNVPPNACTCQQCLPIGNACTDDSQCCGTCFTDPNTGSKTCQIFSAGPLFANLSEFKRDNYPVQCASPDPPTCYVNSDCPCALASGARPACVTTYPDLPAGPPMQGRCAPPPVNQTDIADILGTAPSTTLNCPWFFSKCWWTNLYNKADATNAKVTWYVKTIIQYLFVPFWAPDFMFNLLLWFLPRLMWAPVVAAALGIVDIVICVTFFRSLSESIGGDPTIWGLSRAV